MPKTTAPKDVEETVPALTFGDNDIILHPWDQTLERMSQDWRRAHELPPEVRFVKALRIASLQRNGRVFVLIPDYYRKQVELKEPVECSKYWRENVGPEALDGVHVRDFIAALAKRALPFRIERQQFGDDGVNPGLIRLSEV